MQVSCSRWASKAGRSAGTQGPVRKHTQVAPAGRATNPGRGNSVRDTFQHHGEHKTDTAETRDDSEWMNHPQASLLFTIFTLHFLSSPPLKSACYANHIYVCSSALLWNNPLRYTARKGPCSLILRHLCEKKTLKPCLALKHFWTLRNFLFTLFMYISL